MNPDIFCVDCNIYVKLNLFSKDHKRHEIKLMSDLLEEKKKEFHNLLELRKNENKVDMSCFQDSDKKWQEIQTQATLLKQSLVYHSKQTKAQVERNRLLGYQIIDSEMSKKENECMDQKEKCVKSMENKLLNLKEIVENLDEKSLMEFSLKDPEPTKTMPSFNVVLDIEFKPPSELILDSKHFATINSTVPSTLKSPIKQETLKPRDNPNKTAAPVLAVAHTCIAQASSVYYQNIQQPQNSIQFSESSYYLDQGGSYFLTQDHLNLYVLFKDLKRIKVICKHTRNILIHTIVDFEPCWVLPIDYKLYLIDFSQKYLFTCSILDKDEKSLLLAKVKLSSLPKFISVGNDKTITITSDKIIQSYNPSDRSLKTIPGIENVSGVLKAFDLGSMLFIILHNNGRNLLMCMKDEKTVNEYSIKLDILKKEYFIDVNKNGNICILNTIEKIITVLDSSFKTLGGVHVKQIEAQKIMSVSFFNNNITYITSILTANVCTVFKVLFPNK